MSNNKTQISPIPPEAYGERFIRFITGCTMSKEEAEREKRSLRDQRMDAVNNHPSSFSLNRRSTDKVIEKAEKQAAITEQQGASEDASQDRILGSVRSPSAERTGGIGGATLPVVEEDGEAGSREDSVHNERACGSIPNGDGDLPLNYNNNDGRTPPPTRDPPTPPPSRDPPAPPAPSTNHKHLPSLPVLPRLSMGMTVPPTAIERPQPDPR